MTSHIVAAILLCTATCQPAKVRIWDGDTFLIGMQHGAEKVRIINIDAAEIEGRCPFEIDLAFKAKRRLADIMRGQKVQIIRQGTDRYGRTLAAVRVNGIDAGDELVREGLARTWTGHREPWC